MCNGQIQLSPGSIVCNGRFKVLDHLGQGSFASVYSVLDIGTGQKLALKVAATNTMAQSQLDTEFQVLLQLQDQPGFLRVYGEVLYVQGHKGLLLDLKGCNLMEYINDKGGYLDATATAEIAIMLLNTLERLHDIGIVHYDVKLDNILVDNSNNTSSIYLIDLGLALNYREEQRRGRYWINRKQDLMNLANMLVNIPEKPQEKQRLDHTLADFISYLNNLEYADKPDYRSWRKVFQKYTPRQLSSEDRDTYCQIL